MTLASLAAQYRLASEPCQAWLSPSSASEPASQTVHYFTDIFPFISYVDIDTHTHIHMYMYIYTHKHTYIHIFKRYYLFVFREREREGERERETLMCERYIDELPLARPHLGTRPETQACVPSGYRTSDLSFPRLALNPLSHTPARAYIQNFTMCAYTLLGLRARHPKICHNSIVILSN